MTEPQIVIIVILVSMVALFVWGRWRHDFVAMAALLACVLTGLVPAGEAFVRFGHPAVVTVAGVLVLSGVLQSTAPPPAWRACSCRRGREEWSLPRLFPSWRQ